MVSVYGWVDYENIQLILFVDGIGEGPYEVPPGQIWLDMG